MEDDYPFPMNFFPRLLSYANRGWPASFPRSSCTYCPYPGVAPAGKHQRSFCSAAAATDPLIVSAEAAHVTARRHLGLVHIPDYIAGPPNEAARGMATIIRIMDIFDVAHHCCNHEPALDGHCALAIHQEPASTQPATPHPKSNSKTPPQKIVQLSRGLYMPPSMQTWESTQRHCALLHRTSGMQKSACPPPSTKEEGATPRCTSPRQQTRLSEATAAPISSQRRWGSPAHGRAGLSRYSPRETRRRRQSPAPSPGQASAAPPQPPPATR